MIPDRPAGAVAPVASNRRHTGLVVRDLCKDYPTPGEPLRVLRGVSFDLEAGQSLGILGPSGSGKTTLLNIVGSLDRPTSGEVRLDGVDPFALDGAALARFRSESVGFVFQDHHLLPQLTALENVLVAPLARGRVTAEDERRAADILARVGLTERAGHLPSELSGGERQRVAIARGLVNRPRLILCDEPTGNLDQRTAEEVAALLFSLAAGDVAPPPSGAGQSHPGAGVPHCKPEGGAMLVLVTHSRALAAHADRRLWLRDGRLSADDDEPARPVDA